MGAGLAPVGTGGDHEGAGGIDQRINPGVDTQQISEWLDTIAQRHVGVTRRQQFVSQYVVDGLCQVITDTAGRTAGTFAE